MAKDAGLKPQNPICRAPLCHTEWQPLSLDCTAMPVGNIHQESPKETHRVSTRVVIPHRFQLGGGCTFAGPSCQFQATR